MQKVSLPTKVEIIEDKENKNHGRIIIEPCYPGYGITIGNALRRVLLSSLPGAAVIGFKVKGIQHEFSIIPGVKEDVVEMMMNLKQLDLKVYSEEPVELTLKVKGEKQVKAGDIEKNSDVEIINKDLVICNLTEKNAELELKIWVEQGLGYIPVEERKGEKPEMGVIQLDAVYSPVRKIGIERENVRVGERTDYDKLTLDVETDGSITVGEALEQAAKILVEQFEFVEESQSKTKEGKKGVSGEVKKKEGEEEVKETVGELIVKNNEGFSTDAEPALPLEEKPKKRGRPKKN